MKSEGNEPFKNSKTSKSNQFEAIEEVEPMDGSTGDLDKGKPKEFIIKKI